MKWPLFENKIKEALSGHRSEADIDAIWSAIEPEVDAINRTRRKRRFAWIWFLLAGLLITGSGLAYHFLYSTDTGREKLADFPVALTGEHPEDSGEEIVPSADSDPAIEPAVPAEKGMVPANPEENTTAGDTRPLKQHVQITVAAADEPEEKRSAAAGSSFAGKEPGEGISIPEKGERAVTGTSTGAIPPIADETVSLTDLPQRLPLLQIKEMGLSVSLPLPASMEEDPVIGEEGTPPVVRRNPFRFAAGATGSISFIDRKLGARDAGFDELLTIREGSERMLEAVQAGVRFRLSHTSGLELTTGVNFTQINERFDYNTTVVQTDSVYGIQALVVNLSNDTIPIYGEVPLTRTTTFRKRHYNTYRMIDIPVLLGYRVRTGDFRIGVQAGVFVNLDLSVSGRFLETEASDIDIAEAGIFRADAGLSYQFGLSAAYLLSESLEVYISPSLRYFPRSFTKDNYGLSQEYRLYGLDAGVMYRF